ncbi:MAG TPA: hypothetical protein VF282_09925 [Bacillota bacterium]
MTWVLVAAAAAVLVMAVLGLSRRIQAWRVEEAERRRRQAVHLDQRQRAGRVLAGDVEPLPSAPVDLKDGEHAYYLTPAAELAAEDDGGFRRGARGRLLVTDRAVYFIDGAQVRRRLSVQDIERVDVPFSNVVALVSFRNTPGREEYRAYYEVAEPLLLAAHVSRFTGFELILS